MACEEAAQPQRVVILWTTGEVETAERMVFMYAFNAKDRGWWPEVELLVWGAAQRLLCESELLQEELFKAQQAGVSTRACRACAEMYGLTARLQSLGVEVVPMGLPLTETLKAGIPVLSV
ncbi:MAG: DsrE family protein [Deltaproteobacteria bacterium]|nr:DsrE family protein [Deltaproteobacteria bacterium]